MEYLEVVDENGKPLGRLKERSRIHSDGDWHRTVHLWIVNGRGDALIQKRGPKKYAYPDMWDVSCAGHVLAGDGSRQSAIREAQEELGLVFSPGELHFLGTVRDSYSGGDTRDNEIVDIYVVRRDVEPDECVLQPDEVTDVRLVAASDLRRRVSDEDPGLVPHVSEYRKLFAYLSPPRKMARSP